jgi:hypothetical protein
MADEEILTYTASDEALEAAAGMWGVLNLSIALSFYLYHSHANLTLLR